MFSIDRIREAQARIDLYIAETPLVRLQNLDEYLGCKVYAKLECMQVTGSFKLRGAMNKALSLPEEDLPRGLVAASSGNHGKAVAYAAKKLGTKATIVIPDTTPRIKVEAIKTLGAELVFCETAQRFAIAEKIAAETGGVLLPPYNDEDIMAGQGTAGLEICRQCPYIDKVIVPVSGGGLISGVAVAVKSILPTVKIYGAEPAALPRYSVSIKAGTPTAVAQEKTAADALVSTKPGDQCFPFVRDNTDGFAAVSEEYILKGAKLLLTEGKILAELSSCIGIGAVLQGLLTVNEEDKVCFLISGGSIGLSQIRALEDVVLDPIRR